MMRRLVPGIGVSLGIIAILGAAAAAGETKLPPIQQAQVGPNRAIQVNGKPFFPLMVWLQDAKNFPAVRACGMNTIAGYWPKSSGTKDVAEYLALVEKAGFYGVMPFDPRLKGQPSLLGYIHDDEPDLPRTVSDADVVPAKGLQINRRTPLWRLLDGKLTSWSVLDPLDGASVTVRLKKPVTVHTLAVSLTVSPGLALAKEVAFEAGGAEILRASLQARKGRQSFALPRPATFQALTLKVLEVTPGKHVWGSLGEIEGFDAAGTNVLLSPPRTVPRASPAHALEAYRRIKAADPSRPVFMTLTGNFHPFFKKWSDEQRAIYPEYVKATDVVGFDIYPIYGWNKPQWIHLVYEGTERLARMAGERPVYAWIETSRGSQWTGALARQKVVTPRHIRAEVWMAICGGATAIGYFTHVWKPSYHQFGVPEANRRALREINAQITRLSPAILGRPPQRGVAVASSQGVKVGLRATETAEALYLFAVNYDERLKEARVAFRVEGLAADTAIGVVDERRTIRSGAASFADTFAPLAVHIYKLPR